MNSSTRHGGLAADGTLGLPCCHLSGVDAEALASRLRDMQPQGVAPPHLFSFTARALADIAVSGARVMVVYRGFTDFMVAAMTRGQAPSQAQARWQAEIGSLLQIRRQHRHGVIAVQDRVLWVRDPAALQALSQALGLALQPAKPAPEPEDDPLLSALAALALAQSRTVRKLSSELEASSHSLAPLSLSGPDLDAAFQRTGPQTDRPAGIEHDLLVAQLKLDRDEIAAQIAEITALNGTVTGLRAETVAMTAQHEAGMAAQEARTQALAKGCAVLRAQLETRSAEAGTLRALHLAEAQILAEIRHREAAIHALLAEAKPMVPGLQIGDARASLETLLRERQELIRQGDGLRSLLDRCQSELTASTAERDELRDRERALLEDLQHLDAEQQKILRSRSWKLTEPLRGGRRLLSRLPRRN